MIPASWSYLRSLIESAAGPAIIVGGALRDLDNGRAVKDIDIFVKSGRFDTPDEYEAAMRAGVPGLEIVSRCDPQYIAAMRDEVVFVWTCTVPGLGYEVQIMLANIEKLHDAVRRVDFGICMIGYDGEVVRTPEYNRDQSDQTFTLYNAGTAEHRERSRTRFDRFQTKYPGWKLVDHSLDQMIPISGRKEPDGR